MSKLSVYLAGPIKGLTYTDAVGWRRVAAEHLARFGIEVLSPLRFKQELLPANEAIIDSYDHHPLTTARGITARDRFDVGRCDIVLACFLGAKTASAGTAVEFGWADLLRKPIVMVIEPSGNPFDHPMMREIAAYRVETLEEALELVVCLGTVPQPA